MITIKQLGGDYGLQKLFGTFGAIIWGPVIFSTFLKHFLCKLLYALVMTTNGQYQR